MQSDFITHLYDMYCKFWLGRFRIKSYQIYSSTYTSGSAMHSNCAVRQSKVQPSRRSEQTHSPSTAHGSLPRKQLKHHRYYHRCTCILNWTLVMVLDSYVVICAHQTHVWTVEHVIITQLSLPGGQWTRAHKMLNYSLLVARCISQVLDLVCKQNARVCVTR